MNRKPVVVIGAGLSGLCCARTLVKHDIGVVVLEAQDDIGGRVRTDHVDGFLLDRRSKVWARFRSNWRQGYLRR